MKNLLNKEIKLAASPLSFFFLAFALMALIPGYPIVLSAFFVCLGLFYSFQAARENNDILYTALLPVRKSDVVRAKFIFVIFIQMVFFVLSFALTLLRMTVMNGSEVYVNNPMMNANQLYLAFILLVFALFNTVFLAGFFRTAYKFGKPFIFFVVTSALLIVLGETLHHIPGLEYLNATDTAANALMWIILLASAVIYALVTLASCRASQNSFDKVDL